MIIIMRFGKNNVLCQIYMNFREVRGDVHGPPYIFFVYYSKKQKKYMSAPLLKSNSTSF